MDRVLKRPSVPKHGCGAAKKRLWQVSVPGMPYNIVREEEYNHVPYCYRETQTRTVRLERETQRQKLVKESFLAYQKRLGKALAGTGLTEAVS